LFLILQWKSGGAFHTSSSTSSPSIPTFLSYSKDNSYEYDDDAVTSSTNKMLINNDGNIYRKESELLSSSFSATTIDKKSSSRRMFFASSIVGMGILIKDGPAHAAAAADQEFLWLKNPVNPKRSNFRITDAETTGYNVNFVTYLSRFLLSFDPNAQQWWIDRAGEIPKSSSVKEIFDIRETQFAKFAASVEVGLQEDNFVGRNGPKKLLESLLNQFGKSNEPTGITTALSSSSSDSSGTLPAVDDPDRFTRETKEARRQLALLFGLLEDSQPTNEITTLLASIDNGSIDSVVLDTSNPSLLRGFSPETIPLVEFPQPQAGSGYNRATGKVRLKPTGQLLRIDIIDGGEGYTEPPDVSKLLPETLIGPNATVVTKVVNGKLTSIKIVDNGAGYTQDIVIEVQLKAPEKNGKSAKIAIVPEMEISTIELDEVGSGYAVEKSVKVSLVPSTDDLRVIGVGIPKGKLGSFTANRTPGENEIRNFERKLDDGAGKQVISGAFSGGNFPSSPFPEKATSSQQLLALLPQGFGLEYDAQVKRYILSVDKEYQKTYPDIALKAPNRPLVPDFGPRGTCPIERNQRIDPSTFARFCLSGAICASGVQLALTPLDVVKTKVQIDGDKYPKILPAFQSIWKDEGPSTFYTGWLPTFSGNFIAGGFLYALTEVIRRSLTEAAGANAISLEVPIILAAAGVASGEEIKSKCSSNFVTYSLIISKLNFSFTS
jgi:hypothetical protein